MSTKHIINRQLLTKTIDEMIDDIYICRRKFINRFILFFTDNKGSVNFSIAYHYNCNKRDKMVVWFEEEAVAFDDVSDKYDPHTDFENWPEVFCITNESARQQLLFKKSVSTKSTKNRECYVLQRLALD
ncbi:hypothetical protein Ddc_11042 [Ditylenchus destructor]|nr:hypothetical protein Ddc_11042 [Ditylenchus destructor]